MVPVGLVGGAGSALGGRCALIGGGVAVSVAIIVGLVCGLVGRGIER